MSDAEVVEEGVVLDDEGNAMTEEQVTEKVEGKEEVKEVEYPEWVPEKFRTGEDWQEKMGKSYGELEEKLREKGKLAPEAYEVDDLPVDTEAPEYQGFVDVAKELNLSNEGFNKLLNYAVESGLVANVDYDAEIKSLGPDGDKIISSLKTFATQRLDEKERTTLEGMAYTADQVQVLNKIIRLSDRSVPAKPGEAVGSDKKDMEKKLQGLLGDPSIRNDAVKKAEAEELATKISSM